MPFKSQAQRAHFYATPSLHKYIDEFEAATPPGPLPVRVGPPRGHKHKQRTVTHYSAVTRALAGVKR